MAWFTPRSAEDIHHWAGYAAAGLVAMRIVWGVLGTPYARFSQFVRPPKAIVSYLLAIMRGNEARYVGHNPAGGAMVLTLMVAMLATSFSGWMMTTDAWFGEDWVQNLHRLSADAIVILVFIHVGGVMLASLRHRENLVAAMVSGRKRGADGHDIP